MTCRPTANQRNDLQSDLIRQWLRGERIEAFAAEKDDRELRFLTETEKRSVTKRRPIMPP